MIIQLLNALATVTARFRKVTQYPKRKYYKVFSTPNVTEDWVFPPNVNNISFMLIGTGGMGHHAPSTYRPGGGAGATITRSNFPTTHHISVTLRSAPYKLPDAFYPLHVNILEFKDISDNVIYKFTANSGKRPADDSDSGGAGGRTIQYDYGYNYSNFLNKFDLSGMPGNMPVGSAHGLGGSNPHLCVDSIWASSSFGIPGGYLTGVGGGGDTGHHLYGHGQYGSIGVCVISWWA